MPGLPSLRANPVYPGEGFREGGREATEEGRGGERARERERKRSFTDNQEVTEGR
jgi:hypothetical protein